MQSHIHTSYCSVDHDEQSMRLNQVQKKIMQLRDLAMRPLTACHSVLFNYKHTTHTQNIYQSLHVYGSTLWNYNIENCIVNNMCNHLLSLDTMCYTSLYGYTFLWILAHICFHKHCPKHEQWLFILGGYIAILGATDTCSALHCALSACVRITGSASVMKREWRCCYEKFHINFAKGSSLGLHTVYVYIFYLSTIHERICLYICS